MSAQQRCHECGEAKPIRFRAVFTPRDGGAPLSLVICADCGRAMTSEEFSRTVLERFPPERGAVDLTFYLAE